MLERLTATLTDDFLQNCEIKRIPRHLRKFSLMFAGFAYDAKNRAPVFGLISNYQRVGNKFHPTDAGKFELFYQYIPSNVQSVALSIGQANFIDGSRWKSFCDDAPDRHPRATRARMVNLLQDASRACKLIGGQCTSTAIFPDLEARGEVHYHVLTPQRTLYLPAAVHAAPPKASFMSSIRFYHESPDGPIVAVPHVSRNAPCPCKSGKRYKHCHGSSKLKRIELGYDPATQTVSANGDPGTAPPNKTNYRTFRFI
jgi:hypothetical protein